MRWLSFDGFSQCVTDFAAGAAEILATSNDPNES
jgi:hypothetical protein